ncbi:hypothetical protein HOB10_01090 [Candidatus Parcubacteria bacterium]|jgi:hypothetical protein|nr:hypothetical protein [Candidatus Parcubacteria bacterium]
MRKLSITLFLITVLALPLTALAAQPDSLQVYAFGANTNTFEQKEAGYHQFDWTRAGFRAYKNDFMFRVEYDYSSSSMKYSYLEYSRSYHNWKLGGQWGKYLIPVMYNYPGPSTRPMPRWGYAIKDVPVYGTGMSAYAKRDWFKLQVGQFDFDDYVVNVQAGPIRAWWIKDQAQGMFLKQSLHPWLNLFAGWTNYEDHSNRKFPERRNAAFVQNHVRLSDRVRVFMHQDFGDFKGAFIGGLSYSLFTNDVENTIGIFYDTDNLWQARVTFSFSQIFRLES